MSFVPDEQVVDDLCQDPLCGDETQPRKPYLLATTSSAWAAKWTSEKEPIPESEHLSSKSPGQACGGRFPTNKCDMIWFDLVWFDMIWYDSIQYGMIWMIYLFMFSQQCVAQMHVLLEVFQIAGPPEIQWSLWLQGCLYGWGDGVQQLRFCRYKQQASSSWTWGSRAVWPQSLSALIVFFKVSILFKIQCRNNSCPHSSRLSIHQVSIEPARWESAASHGPFLNVTCTSMHSRAQAKSVESQNVKLRWLHWGKLFQLGLKPGLQSCLNSFFVANLLRYKHWLT